MKITKSTLKRIIKEEYSRMLNEEEQAEVSLCGSLTLFICKGPKGGKKEMVYSEELADALGEKELHDQVLATMKFADYIDQDVFIGHLRKKYGTIEDIARAYATAIRATYVERESEG